VSVSGPTSSNVYDVHDAETDTSPLQAIGITTDTFDASLAAGQATELVTSGFTSTDTNGEKLDVVIDDASADGLLDELPEKAGQSWSNGAAQSVRETSPGGVTSSRTVNADGSYSDTTTFPTGSIYPSPAPTGVIVNAATIVENADGSGSYVFDGILTAGGTPQNVEELDFATPSPAVSGQPAMIPITEPQSGAAAFVVDVPVWYPQPLVLYDESDVDRGETALPAACKVPAAFGTSANAIVQTIVQYDTILGTQETFSQTNYVVPTYGLACVSLSEKLAFYYDYSGQTNIFDLVPNANVTATATYPLEIETIATTLGLTASHVLSVARSSASADAAARAGAVVAEARVTSARNNFVALVEREKLRRKTLLLRKIKTALDERRHR